MKIVGLITEYNPFHNGHLYHIRQAKALTGADAVIAVMSGDFVQRGEPALLPKHLRAQCALSSGASLVIELPVRFATGSAEHFAAGAVSLLDELGCVDALCFGSESGDLEALTELADILAVEPEDYRLALKAGLRSGLSFPAARQAALGSRGALLSEPNNILAVEYLKALKRAGSSIRPYTIRRAGAGFHDLSLQSSLISAAAIRRQLSQVPGRSPSSFREALDRLSGQMPKPCLELLMKHCGSRFPVCADDFSLPLKAALLKETPEHLCAYADVGTELAGRIIRRRNDFITFTGFCQALKTRELTYSRISRALLHILLNIRQPETRPQAQKAGYAAGTGAACHDALYARVLGFAARDAALFSVLKKTSRIPLITRLSQADALPRAAREMLLEDIYAADLYESVVTDRYHTPFQNERLQQIVKL